MVIGIVGKGKMGFDLFQVLLDYEHELVLVGRSGMEELQAKIEKLINRKKKRGLLTDDEAKAKLDSLCFTTDYRELKDCDLVLETIAEDMDAKRRVMKQIEEYVGEECIIATNTSSLPIKEIFASVERKERCMGMHFFYPIKLIPTVEISRIPELCEHALKKACALLEDVGRKVLVLEEGSDLIISRILTTIASDAYFLYENSSFTYQQIDEMAREHVMMFGPFEIINATGFSIIAQCLKNFMDSNHRERYQALLSQVEALEAKGLTAFLDVEESADKVTASEEDAKSILEQMKDGIVREIQYYWDSGKVTMPYYYEAVKDALGLECVVEEMGIRF